MKSTFLLILSSFSSLFLIAQTPVTPAAIWEEFRENREKVLSTQLKNDVVVLDSFHNWSIIDQNLTLSYKGQYDYNGQAKQTKYTAYHLNELTNQFYESIELNNIYTPFDEFRVLSKRSMNQGPLENNERRLHTTNPLENDAIVDSWIELWDKDDQQWVPYRKDIQLLKTEDKRIQELSLWKEDQAAYELFYKNETNWYGELNTRNEGFQYDVQTKKYFPSQRTITEYNEDGILELFEDSSWDAALNAWVPRLKLEYFYDLPNHPDYALVKLDLTNDGQLEVLDSSIWIHDAENRLLLDSLFSFNQSSNSFELSSIYVYNRLSNGYLDTREIFEIVDTEPVLEFHTNYFYSDITIATAISQPTTAPFKLSFENPSSQIKLQLDGAEDLGEIAFSLYDLNGQLLDHAQVLGNTSLSLGNGKLPPGLYLISVTVDQQKFSWKVVVQ